MADLSKVKLDPNVEENSGGFTVVPEGVYKAVIAADKLSKSKDGAGRMLELKVQIISGKFAGTSIIDRINIINKSDIAEKIGQGQLKRICNLLGVSYPPQDTAGLLGKPLSVTVKIEEFESNTTRKMLQSNKISAYNKADFADNAPSNPVNDAPHPADDANASDGW